MLPKFNSESPKHMSLLFFGGFIKIKVTVADLDKDGDIRFIQSGEKVGQIKTKKVEKEVYIKGLGLQPLDNWKAKREGEYKTNKQILEFIAGDILQDE